MIAGFIVLQAFKVLAGKANECKNMYLAVEAQSKGRIINSAPSNMFGPNKKCATCQVSSAEVTVNTQTCTVGFLTNEILKKGFGMVMPEVSRGSALLVTDFDETDAAWDEEEDREDLENQINVIFPQSLEAVKIVDGTTLMCEDKLQAFKFSLLVHHCDEVADERGYVLGGNAGSAKALSEKNDAESAEAAEDDGNDDDDDDLEIIEQEDTDDEDSGGAAPSANGKRPREEEEEDGGVATVVEVVGDDDDEIQEIDAPVEPGAKRAKSA